MHRVSNRLSLTETQSSERTSNPKRYPAANADVPTSPPALRAGTTLRTGDKGPPPPGPLLLPGSDHTELLDVAAAPPPRDGGGDGASVCCRQSASARASAPPGALLTSVSGLDGWYFPATARASPSTTTMGMRRPPNIAASEHGAHGAAERSPGAAAGFTWRRRCVLEYSAGHGVQANKTDSAWCE